MYFGWQYFSVLGDKYGETSWILSVFQLNVIANCACGFHKETCKHYFLDCLLYNTWRETLIGDLRNFNLTLRNLLYGDHNLSDQIHVLAYLAFQKCYESNLWLISLITRIHSCIHSQRTSVYSCVFVLHILSMKYIIEVCA